MDIKHELETLAKWLAENINQTHTGLNTISFKTNEIIYINETDVDIEQIEADSFIEVNTMALKQFESPLSSTPLQNEGRQVMYNLYRCTLFPENKQQPPFDTLIHQLFDKSYVLHVYPTEIQNIMCSKDARKAVSEITANTGFFVEKQHPFDLREELNTIKKESRKLPDIIFSANNGIYLQADTKEKLQQNLLSIIKKAANFMPRLETTKAIAPDKKITRIVPVLRMLLAGKDQIPVATTKNTTFIQNFINDNKKTNALKQIFAPEITVHCGYEPILIQEIENTDECIGNIKNEIDAYKEKYELKPVVFLIKDIGIVTVERNYRKAEQALTAMEKAMQIIETTEKSGGLQTVDNKIIKIINETTNTALVDKKCQSCSKLLKNKIAVVTGGSQGFGGGIVEHLANKGVHVVIADINEATGSELANSLNKNSKGNKVVVVKTDVSNAESVENLIKQTVQTFGGVDVFISNAGVLRAGGLDEMQPDTFEFMTKVNYTGYFLCAKYASEVMKLQHKYNKQHFMDIIQINSKSGLKGSNKNFAYAGGKFGGVGLTQSFAMELMPFHIKVNSVCPGNFFDGPLWADPEKGLFVQYLNAGKVPGAKSIEDVKQHYENQVPAKRGCTVEDVMKAVQYIIDQQYETGQAVPVTGGQIMLK